MPVSKLTCGHTEGAETKGHSLTYLRYKIGRTPLFSVRPYLVFQTNNARLHSAWLLRYYNNRRISRLQQYVGDSLFEGKGNTDPI